MQPTELERAISDIVHHIFKRQVLPSVSPADSLLQVGNVSGHRADRFMSMGLWYLTARNQLAEESAGPAHHSRVRPPSHRDDWFQSAASEIMSHPPSVMEASEPLSVALDIFRKTRFAFVPGNHRWQGCNLPFYTRYPSGFDRQAGHACWRDVFAVSLCYVQH